MCFVGAGLQLPVSKPGHSSLEREWPFSPQALWASLPSLLSSQEQLATPLLLLSSCPPDGPPEAKAWPGREEEESMRQHFKKFALETVQDFIQTNLAYLCIEFPPTPVSKLEEFSHITLNCNERNSEIQPKRKTNLMTHLRVVSSEMLSEKHCMFSFSTHLLSSIFLNSALIRVPLRRPCSMVMIFAKRSSRMSSSLARTPARKNTCNKL